MNAPDLSDYVEVADRIAAFYEKYPEGSLQGSYELTEIGSEPIIVYQAQAFRTPEDVRPGVGTASEPYPGKTPYTKDSELMNAETSAWGRALAALGFEVKHGIASANEVRARQTSNSDDPKLGFVSEKQRTYFERLLKEAGVPGPAAAEIVAYAREALTGSRGGTLTAAIDGLKAEGTREEYAERLLKAAREHHAKRSDVPIDTEGLPLMEAM